MKTLKSTALVLGLFALLAGTTTLVRAQDYQNDYQNDGYSTGNISLQTFYDELSPYGTWIQDPQYGYVWRPDVDQNEFRPYYTNGRWAMTEYGNTWVSNYDWGWAPFHYGRWVINSYRQWIWLPDTNWGPAWVDWRSGDGYYGWAPMAPSISINLSFGRRYAVPEFCWNFIPQRNIYINTFPRYDYGRNNVYIRNTTIINNTYVYNRRTYYGGPRVEDIRRATNRDVTVYRYAQSSRPGASRVGGREVSIYRPRPERNAVDNRNAAPRRFEQGNAGISRGGRNEGYTNRDQRGGNPGNNDNRFGSRDNRTSTQPDRNNNNQPNNRGEAYNRDANGRISRGGTNGIDNGNRQENANRGQDQQRLDQIRQQRNQDRMSTDQQRNQRNMQPQQPVQNDQQRAQMDQQRAQRNEQMQQQRAQQVQQQQQERTQRDAQAQQQRNEQMQQQRVQQAQQQQQERTQRDAQAQQQRNEQMQQQRVQQAQQQQQERAQRDAQAQQQRAQQAQQERAQRDAQAQQQRAQQQQQRQEQRREAPPQQRGGGESGRPSRGGRG
ncbi:DUF6600 domain-containing protein [Pedobacter alluvionis]|uniref:Uncharacterized protein n=1 Tax=Pedobacter alluvionis TaxID=475253 RepID=A0A497XY88_9SPHI|nr:DUF6600 domain-containing protein [Pedobacter alluvionis]RLJ71903.1 hypothetical protein BCL90_4724 [Pedobacter alluvionis]TFB28686.1 hypothetical protein E3V97_21425 [Pedobacter alluvionis]